MPTLNIDVVEGAQYREENGRVHQATRMAVVTDITASGGDVLLPQDALDYLALQGYVSGASHPAEVLLRLKERNVHMLGASNAIVELVYKRPRFDAPPEGFNSVISIDTAVEGVESNKEVNGDPILVFDSNGISQTGTITVYQPRMELNFERIEGNANPDITSEIYTGKVNSALWNRGLIRTWICTRIGFELEDGSTNPPLWRASYSFRYNKRRHDPEVIFIDPETGRPPPGLVPGFGFRQVKVYEEADFNALALT